MNGVHDMGGMHGFGVVQPELNEAVFHASWEGRVLGMVRTVLFTRAFNLDVFRHAQERLPPEVYLNSSYYYRWYLAIANSAIEHGLISADELEAGHALHPARPVERTMSLSEMKAATVRPPFGREPTHEARFKPGDRVRTLNLNPVGHTRLPRYARDKLGRVEVIRGCHVFPDAKVNGEDVPTWLYTVAFRATELWGDEADPTLTVSVEAFEPYLMAI